MDGKIITRSEHMRRHDPLHELLINQKIPILKLLSTISISVSINPQHRHRNNASRNSRMYRHRNEQTGKMDEQARGQEALRFN